MMPRKLTPFDRLGLKEGNLIVAVRQMDGLHAAVNKHRQAKEAEIIEIQRRKERERISAEASTKPSPLAKHTDTLTSLNASATL